MALWHGQLDSDSVGIGSQLTVSSPHQVVRMVTADQLSIETSGGNGRVAAIVLDRTGGQMTVSFLNGRSANLQITSDHSLEREDAQTEFSSQEWRVSNVH
jgi:hypothetical protein